MPAKPRTLSVVANPWLHIDVQGRPCAACPMDVPPGRKAFVGARVSPELTKILKKGNPLAGQDHVQDTVWEFDLSPQTVPDTPYYRHCLRTGEILPADEKAAQAAGHAKFVKPDVALAEARKVAIAAFNAREGDGAFEALEQERETEIKKAKAAEPKKSAATATTEAKGNG